MQPGQLDRRFIAMSRQFGLPFARVSLAVIYLWFGALKLFAVSPASPLVAALLSRLLPGIPFDVFNLWFGAYEVIIGALFLFPRFTRQAILLILPHLVMTGLPLILLPGMTWQAPFVPTLEGQYIIKNLLILAVVLRLAAHMHSGHDGAYESPRPHGTPGRHHSR